MCYLVIHIHNLLQTIIENVVHFETLERTSWSTQIKTSTMESHSTSYGSKFSGMCVTCCNQPAGAECVTFSLLLFTSRMMARSSSLHSSTVSCRVGIFSPENWGLEDNEGRLSDCQRYMDMAAYTRESEIKQERPRCVYVCVCVWGGGGGGHPHCMAAM